MSMIKLLTKPARASLRRATFGLFAIILIVASALVVDLDSQVANVTRMISAKQAEDLLRTYLRSKGYDTKNAPLDIELAQDSGKGSYSDFYLYGVYVDTPRRLVTIGSYGVNRITGDIWERIECTRINSKVVAGLQKEILESSGLTAIQLKQLRSANPCFDDPRTH
jgi:hypothetical protein